MQLESMTLYGSGKNQTSSSEGKGVNFLEVVLEVRDIILHKPLL